MFKHGRALNEHSYGRLKKNVALQPFKKLL